MSPASRDFVASLATLCEQALSEEASLLAEPRPDFSAAAWWAEFASACSLRAFAICREGRA